jgi:CRP-like cAMP-binding protein
MRLNSWDFTMFDNLTDLGLPTEIAHSLVHHSKSETYHAGELLYASGDESTHMFFLRDADNAVPRVVEIVLDGDGRGSPVGRVADGCVGHVEFLGRNDSDRCPGRIYSVRALTTVTVLRVPYAVLLSLDPEHLRLIERYLARDTVIHYQAALEGIRASRSSNPAALLAATILSLAEDIGAREGGGRRLVLRKTQQDLADEVGLRREVVNGHLNEWDRAGLLSFNQGGLAVLDIERFRGFVEMSRTRSRKNHDRALKRIDAALSQADNFRARNLALDSLKSLPNSPELQHRAMLATARCESYDEMETLIKKFEFGVEVNPSQIRSQLQTGLRNPLQRSVSAEVELETDDDDDAGQVQAGIDRRLPELFEDTLAFPARCQKGRFWSLARDRQEIGAKALAGYERAFQATGRTYSGINAAAMAGALGDKSRSVRLANDVLRRLNSPNDYWSYATRAEALAICGEWDMATAALSKAVNSKGASPGAIASTRRHFVQLGSALDQKISTLVDALPQIGVAAFTGHMMLGSQLDDKTQLEQSARVVPQIVEAIRQFRLKIGYGALACGGDLLLAEQLLAAGGAFHAVLPFRVNDFISVSVMPGIPEDRQSSIDWQKRFVTALSRSTSLSIAFPGPMSNLQKSEIDHALYISNRRAVGCALLKADELVTEPVVLAIYDGARAQSMAGTATLVETCRDARIEVRIIECPWRKRRSPAPPARDGMTLIYRPLLFIWMADAESTGTSSKSINDSTNKVLAGVEELVRKVIGKNVKMTKRTDRRSSFGLVLSPDCTADTVETAFALRDGQHDFKFRIICDFGPIYRPSKSIIDWDRLSLVESATDIINLPQNRVVATKAFASEARFANSKSYRFSPVGRVSVGDRYESNIPIPSVEFYLVQRR